MVIPISNTLRLQSPYLFCQAAGSDGTDQTVQGIHVRWDLMKELGYNHIPKGTLAGNANGFNKPNDYVSLYRGTYGPGGMLTIDFRSLSGSLVTFLPGDAGISYQLSAGHNPTNIIVRFSDRNQFRSIVNSGLDPRDPVQDFLNRYTGLIELEVENRLMFKYEFTFASGNGRGDARIETISIPDRLDQNSKRVIKREYKSYEDLMKKGFSTIGENIKYFRLKQNAMPAPLTITMHTYEDFFNEMQSGGFWNFIGNFSLSNDDLTVFSRLLGRNYNGGTLNFPWPRYNDGVLLRGDNFMDKWFNADGGLKGAVNQFIQLSNTDPRANINYPSDVPGDDNGLTVSMLDMLKLVGLDYHGARMLGFGHLDLASGFPTDVPQVYAAVYTTLPSLPGFGPNNDHVFLSLPTAMTDYRLPLEPILQPPSYGLYITNDDGTQQLISDSNGYSQYEDLRFINLSKTNKAEPQLVQTNMPIDGGFDVTQITMATSFGIEYKTQGQAGWNVPEILHDDEYTSLDNNLESLTVPERDENPVYTHRETASGIHEYAMYSVNWFSRVSGLSNSVQTDQTVFQKHNTLLPPLNLAVQYIQEEDPLIFTTQQEQNDLAAANAANPNGDNCKTRVTFDWDNLHNNAYRVANKIEFYFRETPIQKIEGQIKSVSSVSDTEAMIVSQSYVMASVNPPVTLSPAITSGTESKYIGSLLNTPNGQFQITSIAQPTQPGDGPSFIVKKLVSVETIQATPDDPITTVPVYTPPTVNDLFFIFENVSETNQWTRLNRTVDIYNFSNAAEIIYEDDGSSHTETVGGINGNALIEEIQYQGSSTGGYTISFSGVNLPAHPDPTVSWVKGSARFVMNANPNKKKRLPVVSIQQTSPLIIVVFDPDYPNAAERIQTGSNIPVNFHPGYKLYLDPEPGVFDKNKIMPVANVNNKKTFIAARSADTSVPFYSSLTPPAVLLARSIQKPVMPEAVVGPLFATRPDFYGKSTYTLDIQLNITNRKPFGVVVYRSNEISILQALYKPATVTQVLADLAAISDNDPLQFNRWRSLVEVETDPADSNKFKLFGSYRFPNPDNDSTEMFITAISSIHPFPLQAGETILSKKATIKQVIEDIFSPLTETPIVFEYLKAGYQTSSAQPVTRSIIGRLLDPSDINFNPYPMAVKFPAANPNTVRFTDYTLSGNARNIYFYFAREIAVDTKLSARTPVSGPVVLVDAAPAEKPKIRSVVTQEADLAINQPVSVVLDLADYISPEKIRQYQVFRSTEFANASTVRTMQLASTVNVGDAVEDTFQDLSFPPFGQPLYYRVVALRQIVNEKGEIEMIPSQPSEVVLTNIIDAVNPTAPVVTPNVGTTQTNGAGQVTALLNVTLQWPQTVYNGTYHLYKMGDSGNWIKLWSKKTNTALISFPENGDFVTYPQTANLPKLDANGNVIYHRFRVVVENASGLFSLEDKELVI